MGTQNAENSSTGSTETRELVTINSLIDLKKELNIETLDTSFDSYFKSKENVTINITRVELENLKKEMIGNNDTQKIERLKSIITSKEIIKASSATQRSELKSELDKKSEIQKTLELSPTPENMRKAFELLNEGKYEDAQRYMLISQIIKVFIHGNSFSIKEDGVIFKDHNVVEKDGKRVEDFSKVLDKYLTKEEFRNVRLYDYIKSGRNVAEDANAIAGRYGIRLDNSGKAISEEEKASLRTQIHNARDDNGKKISEEDQLLLLTYIGGDFKKVERTIITYENITQRKGDTHSKELEQKTGITWKADYARNPERLVVDIFNKMGPLGLLGAVGLVIGKIFDFNVFDSKDGKGNFLMKLFAVGAGLGLYKAIGMGEHVGNLIENKEGSRDMYNNGAKAAVETGGAALTWAGGIISKTPEKFKGSVKELAERVKIWYDFSNVQYTKPDGIKADVIGSDFISLYSNVERSTPGLGLSRQDGKKIEAQDLTNLTSRINEYKTLGITKYGSEKVFKDEMSGCSLAQAIDKITDNKTVQTVQNDPNHHTKAKKSTVPTTTPTAPISSGQSTASIPTL